MITDENEIPSVVDSMNEGNGIPDGVEPIYINRKKLIYTYIYFVGLGVYRVDVNPVIKVMTDEEAQERKNT